MLDETNTVTQLCRVKDILNLLSDDSILTLQGNNFIHTPPETFNHTQKIIAPIIQRYGNHLEIAVSTHNIKPINSKATVALNELCSKMATCSESIAWKPGTMVVLNNLSCLHGRSAIKNGARWLQRCYGTERPSHSNIIDLDALTLQAAS